MGDFKSVSPPMKFRQMLASLLRDGLYSQQQVAAQLGISPQYLSDLLQGRRLPSIKLINAVCAFMGRGPKGRREWHLAGAREHGWEV